MFEEQIDNFNKHENDIKIINIMNKVDIVNSFFLIDELKSDELGIGEILNYTFRDVEDDLESAMFNLLCGKYKAVGVSLRNALDMSMCSLYFTLQYEESSSETNIKFIKWREGRMDTPNWTTYKTQFKKNNNIIDFNSKYSCEVEEEVHKHFKKLSSYTHGRPYFISKDELNQINNDIESKFESVRKRMIESLEQEFNDGTNYSNMNIDEILLLYSTKSKSKPEINSKYLEFHEEYNNIAIENDERIQKFSSTTTNMEFGNYNQLSDRFTECASETISWIVTMWALVYKDKFKRYINDRENEKDVQALFTIGRSIDALGYINK